MKRLLLFAIVVLGFSAASFGQSSATASTTATLIVPISIDKDIDMDFGTIGASNTAGTVELDYDNTVNATGGATVITGGTPNAAVFIVTGDGASAITVNIPEEITLTESVSGATMTVDNFEANTGLTPSLDGGTLEIKVRAILNVPADAVEGTYENDDDLEVTVNYQ